MKVCIGLGSKHNREMQMEEYFQEIMIPSNRITGRACIRYF